MPSAGSASNAARATAIITARGGSKGLSRKNVRDLAGHPLIAYSIEAALATVSVDRCIVSTEDAEIRDVSLAYGAEVIDRPVELAQDTTRSADVVRHVLSSLSAVGAMPEHFVLLQPTSPLRHQGHLDACLQAYFGAEVCCALSVCELAHHPYKALRLEAGRLEPLFHEADLDRPRQQLPEAYRQNGAIYVMATKTFLEVDRFYARPALPFVMSQRESVDIDDLRDLELAAVALSEQPPPSWPRRR